MVKIAATLARMVRTIGIVGCIGVNSRRRLLLRFGILLLLSDDGLSLSIEGGTVASAR